jgi:N-acetylneuraminic acid mutarotase
MPTARSQPAIAVVDGKIHVIGGYDNADRILSAVEVYEPATDTWIRKAEMSTARMALGTCVVDERIYVSGGATKFAFDNAPGAWGCVPTVEIYDSATDTWTQGPDMPRIRAGHSASVIDGEMYIIGGEDREQIGNPISTVDVYNPDTDTWTTAADFPNPRGMTNVAVVDGKIYIIGGLFGGPGTEIMSSVYEFDPGLPGVISSVSPAGKLLETWGQIKKVQ